MQIHKVLTHGKKYDGKKYVGTEFLTCPRCTVLRLRLVQLQISYFSNSISFAWHNQFFVNNFWRFFVDVKHLRNYNVRIKQNTKISLTKNY